MNFYGHAQFAARLGGDAGFALGSMIPDFEGMCGARVSHVDEGSVARGIALHHATDEAFHFAAPFLDLCRDGLESMLARGVPRASARACAHVGTELVYDAHLLALHGPSQLYLDALGEGVTASAGPGLLFDDEGARFAALCERLRGFGVPHAYGQPGYVAARLFDALSRRPRLALAREHVPAVEAWLNDAIPSIYARATELDRIVDDALGIIG